MDTPSSLSSSTATTVSPGTTLTASSSEPDDTCVICELDPTYVESFDASFSNVGPAEDQAVVARRLYTPIHPWETRLLTLHRGKGVATLTTTLDVATVTRGRGLVIKELNELVPYFALSYNWGDPRFDWPLEVNGEMYPVTKNLFRALIRLSYSNNPVRVWIDAICINQHDSNEKSAHIRNIFSFFQDADTVVVWLGERGVDTAAAIHFASSEASARRAPQQHLCERHEDVFYRGLADLLQRKWFTRTWVRQEVWAAKKLAFLCGGTVMSWSTVRRLYLIALRYASPHLGVLLKGAPLSRQGIEVASQEEVLTRGLGDYRNPLLLNERSQRMDIINVLDRTSACECSDPRDRIYGVVGMSTTVIAEVDGKSDEPSLQIDYNKSVSNVFQDVSRYIMARDQSLALLHLEAWYGVNVEGESLPTWAVNWQCPVKRGYWLKLLRILSEHIELPPLIAATFSIPDCLVLRGLAVAQIVADETVTQFVFDRRAADRLHHHSRSTPWDTQPAQVFPSGPVGPDLEKLAKAYIMNHAVVVSIDTMTQEVSIRTQQLLLNRTLPWKAHAELGPEKIPLTEVDSRPLMSQGSTLAACKTVSVRMMEREGGPDFTDQPTFFHEDPPHPAHENKRSERWCKQQCRLSKPFRIQDGSVYSSWSVPRQSRKGDVLVFSNQSYVPLILRLSSTVLGSYEYVGPAMIIAGSWSGKFPCCDGLSATEDEEASSFIQLETWLTKNMSAGESNFTLV